MKETASSCDMPVASMRKGVKHSRDELAHVHGRLGLAVFPARHRLTGDVKLLGQILLGHAALLPRRGKGFLERHVRPFLQGPRVVARVFTGASG